MEYRRFGKTNISISVITLGGMRYTHGWEKPKDEIPPAMIEQCTLCVQEAFKNGINHIETAYGYGKSEKCYGIVLNEELGIPRKSYYLMTKGNPNDAYETRKLIDEQLKLLKTNYFDFYAWHGINNDEIFKNACKSGGPVEELLRMKEEGIIKNIGFSTHGHLKTIISSIKTNLFDFINLHYYYFFQTNHEAILEAHKRNMGVFIISPNDKGGQLFNAPQKLIDATKPLSPIQWNARFCLSNRSIHTLSFGMTQKSHFQEMKGIFPIEIELSTEDKIILSRLNSLATQDKYSDYDGYDLLDDPSNINIPEVLRFRKMWKCYDMNFFCRYRYNMFESKGHWFPGEFATEENIAKINENKIPKEIPLKQLLSEFHREFYQK